jgi:hypothetical protein
MKIFNDANTTIIGSNTTVVVPDSDSICAYVAITCNSGKTYVLMLLLPVTVVRHIRLRRSATMH